MFALRFLVSNLFPHACVWSLWLIPLYHCPRWTALGFDFHFSFVQELALGSTFSSFSFPAQCKSPSSIAQILEGAQRLTILLVRRGITASMKLASQLLIPASTTLSCLPSCCLGKLLCYVLSNNPSSRPGCSW